MNGRIGATSLRASLLVVSILFTPIALCAHPCMHYAGEPVSLAGKVVLRTFFGPPNYGENPDTDSRETQAILILPRPICVDANAADNDAAENGQSEVTLVSVSIRHTSSPTPRSARTASSSGAGRSPADRTTRHGGMRGSAPGCRRCAGTTCGTPGQRGTLRPERRPSCFRRSADGRMRG